MLNVAGNTSSLRNLEELEVLELDDNLITDISAIENLSKLKEVNLEHNKVEQLKILDSIKRRNKNIEIIL